MTGRPLQTPREWNSVVKDPRRVDVLFGYCFPSSYRAGMTSLSTHLFYAALNQREDTSCERYFRHDVPSPGHSLESGRPLCDNHIVGFSLTYEEDILNVVQMLEAGGVTPLTARRSPDDPVVVLGGPAVSANPEPYVDFVDAFVIGEGDLVIHRIVDVVREASSRDAVLDALADLPGVYLPVREQPFVERIILPALDPLFHPTAQVVPDVATGSRHEPVFGRCLLVEVTRGCGHSCKFCLVGHICRPRRSRSVGRLQEIIDEGTRLTPVGKVALIGSSLADMGRLEELVAWTVDRDLGVSVPSLRADSVTADLLAGLVIGGQRVLTIAPETGSARLRYSVGKAIDDSVIEGAVSLAASVGMRSVKLYFIVGLPGETDADVHAIAGLVRRLARSHDIRMTVSITPFVPKAHTRFESAPQLPVPEIRRRLRMVLQGLRDVPRVAVESLDPRHARIQAALSIGDRTLGQVILRAASYGGLGGWRRAERETGIPMLGLPTRDRASLSPPPWAFIRHPSAKGTSRERL